MYQNKSLTPFETHPTTIKAFFFTFYVYCSALVAKSTLTHLTSYSQILIHINLITRVISSLSLLTIFLPSWLNKLIISILGVFIPLILERHMVKLIYQQLSEKTMNAVIYLVDVFDHETEFNGTNTFACVTLLNGHEKTQYTCLTQPNPYASTP